MHVSISIWHERRGQIEQTRQIGLAFSKAFLLMYSGKTFLLITSKQSETCFFLLNLCGKILRKFRSESSFLSRQVWQLSFWNENHHIRTFIYHSNLPSMKFIQGAKIDTLYINCRGTLCLWTMHRVYVVF